MIIRISYTEATASDIDDGNGIIPRLKLPQHNMYSSRDIKKK